MSAWRMKAVAIRKWRSSPLVAEAVEELFGEVRGARLIRRHVHWRNKDSHWCCHRFHYCAVTASLRVLQQPQPKGDMTRFVVANAMRHIARPAVGAVHSIMSRFTQLHYDKRNMANPNPGVG